jgi:hypothetical protein
MRDEYRLEPGGLKLTPYSLNTLAKQAHATAVEKGFYPDEGRIVFELLALIHSEVSEALECVRKGQLTAEVHAKGAAVPVRVGQNGHLQVELENVAWNPQGQAFTWYELTPERAQLLGIELKPVGLPSELADIIIRTLDLAAFLGIDMDKAIVEKLTYNATRPHKHGGKAA